MTASRRLSLSYFDAAPLTISFYSSRVTEITDSTVQFGLIPNDHWNQPAWVNETKATESRDDMVKNNVIYGGASGNSFLSSFFNPCTPFQAAFRMFSCFVLAVFIL